MEKTWQMGKIYELLNEKEGGKSKYSLEKYVILIAEDQSGGRAKDAMTRELIDRFGGYDAFGRDERLIDPKTKVLNLKTNLIEIRPKIFTDKPTEK